MSLKKFFSSEFRLARHAVHTAAGEGDIYALLKLLEKHGEEVVSKTLVTMGTSAAGNAFNNEQVEALALLLACGGKIVDSYDDEDRGCPVLRAAVRRNKELVQVLLAAGFPVVSTIKNVARVYFKNNRDKTSKEIMALLEKACPEAPQVLPAVSAVGDFDVAVESGDVERVRAVFDAAFIRKHKIDITAAHLKRAMCSEDASLLRLLVNWGGRLSKEDVEGLTEEEAQRYPHYSTLLRQLGLPPEEIMPLSARQEPAVAKKKKVTTDDWVKVLSSLQAAGAEEAIIAGGALRDYYNKRPVKDVDIFLKSRGSQEQNRKFLLSATGAVFSSYDQSYVSMEKKLGNVESWKIFDSDHRREYNIIFIERFKDAPPGLFLRAVPITFDFGICQIATDGRALFTTAAYNEDVKNETVTMTAHTATMEHMKRIHEKYKDWRFTFDEESIKDFNAKEFGGTLKRKYLPPAMPPVVRVLE